MIKDFIDQKVIFTEKNDIHFKRNFGSIQN